MKASGELHSAIRVAVLLAALVALGACARSGGDGMARNAPAQPAPGSDRDAHGCIGSAGYVWCEQTGQCERPWELARDRQLESTPEAFDAFCAGKPAD